MQTHPKNELIMANTNGAVLEIQINRPDKLNALTDFMYGSLITKLQQAENDAAIKVILLRSSGPHFSAGNDLADFLEIEFNVESNVIQFLVTLAKLTKPIIAAVNGVAVGIGSTLLLHCDLVYAASDTKFSVPFIKLGLTPEGGSSKLLAERCGVLKANDWLLTGRNILVDEALACGFINQVNDDAQSNWDAAMFYAQKLAKNSTDILLETKKLFKADQRSTVIELIEKEAEVFEKRLQSEEVKIAFDAFLSR